MRGSRNVGQLEAQGERSCQNIHKSRGHKKRILEPENESGIYSGLSKTDLSFFVEGFHILGHTGR